MIIATKWRFLGTSEDVSILEEIDESGSAQTVLLRKCVGDATCRQLLHHFLAVRRHSSRVSVSPGRVNDYAAPYLTSPSTLVPPPPQPAL